MKQKSLEVVLPKFSMRTFSETASVQSFKFYIDNKCYCCQTYLICLVSSAIKRQILVNNTLLRYVFRDIRDPRGQFSDFIDMINGAGKVINEDNAIFLHNIARDLEIEELLKATCSYVNVTLTKDNAFCLLSKLAEINVKNDMFRNIMRFIYSNWESFKNDNRINELNLETYKFLFDPEMLSELKVYNEQFGSWQVDFISSLVKKNGEKFNELYELCSLEYLPKKQISFILDDCIKDSLTYNFINGAVRQKFIQNVKPERRSKRKQYNNPPLFDASNFVNLNLNVGNSNNLYSIQNTQYPTINDNAFSSNNNNNSSSNITNNVDSNVNNNHINNSSYSDSNNPYKNLFNETYDNAYDNKLDNGYNNGFQNNLYPNNANVNETFSNGKNNILVNIEPQNEEMEFPQIIGQNPMNINQSQFQGIPDSEYLYNFPNHVSNQDNMEMEFPSTINPPVSQQLDQNDFDQFHIPNDFNKKIIEQLFPQFQPPPQIQRSISPPTSHFYRNSYQSEFH